MHASHASRARHFLGRLAVVGAVALGAPVALAGVADAAPKGHWDRIAKCESGGRWNTATGNGYYGGRTITAAPERIHHDIRRSRHVSHQYHTGKVPV